MVIVMLDTNTIIQVSLIGLGLLLALYTLTMGKIDDFRELNKKKSNIVKEIIEARKNSKNENAKLEFSKLKIKVEKTIKGKGYEFDFGYFVSGVLFMLAFIIGVFSLVFINTKDIFNFASSIILIIGIINLFIIWLLIMLAFRRLLLGKIEIQEE